MAKKDYKKVAILAGEVARYLEAENIAFESKYVDLDKVLETGSCPVPEIFIFTEDENIEKIYNGLKGECVGTVAIEKRTCDGKAFVSCHDKSTVLIDLWENDPKDHYGMNITILPKSLSESDIIPESQELQKYTYGRYVFSEDIEYEDLLAQIGDMDSIKQDLSKYVQLMNENKELWKKNSDKINDCYDEIRELIEGLLNE